MRSLACMLGAVSAVALSPTARAAPNVATASAVFVERAEAGNLRSLEPAERLNRGDRVVTVVTWQRMGGGDFTITNPLPRAIAYQASALDSQEVRSTADGAGADWASSGSATASRRPRT